MDCKEAGILFENVTKMPVVQIKRSSVGIANYVFMILAAGEKYVLRCSKEEDAYQDTVYWLEKLLRCGIPIPAVLWEGSCDGCSYLILSYLPGDDIGNVYNELSDDEKKQIAKDVVKIQRKVSEIDIQAEGEWKWNSFVEELLDRAEERIKRNHYFDENKVHTVRKLQRQIQYYLDQVRPTPYLDDISTKNLLIHEGRVSGIIDIDWIGQGDVLTFAALTRVALLNMEQDTKYVDCLLEEFQVSEAEYKAFVFYCLIYCVDFMGERGTRFLDQTIPVNEDIIKRLNTIFDTLMAEWKQSEVNMQVIEYHNSGRQEHWLERIKKSDWSAGQFLYELLKEDKFFEMVGERSKVMLLVDGDELISFCTYAEKDDIQPTELTPWVGFVYTFPKYRGHRYLGKLLKEIEKLAKAESVREIYISTDKTGLYEKYGCTFYQMMDDMNGEPSRVYRKQVE